MQESERRHHHQREAHVQAAEPGADQPHVVVQRQPADEHVARRGLDRLRHGADVGQQVVVRQRHSLRVSGAARGVLDERDVVTAQRDRRWLAAGCAELLRGRQPAQARHTRLQQARHHHRFGHGDEQHGLRVGQDAGVAQHMVFELRRARWRIDRHRNRTRLQDAQVGAEVLGRGRQHDRHALPRPDPGTLQAGGERRRGVGKLTVGRGLLGIVVQEDDLRLLRVGLQMPVEHAEQRGRIGDAVTHRCRAVGRRRDVQRPGCSARRPVRPRCWRALLHGLQQIAHGLGPLQRVLRQLDAKRALAAEHELHPGQAVEPEVAVELACKRHRRHAGSARVQFAQCSVDHGQQRLGSAGRGGGVGRRCGSHAGLACAHRRSGRQGT